MNSGDYDSSEPPALSSDWPATVAGTDGRLSGTSVIYALPRRWSLYYALTQKQWKAIRERYKEHHPNWQRCSCPKGCKADALDEEWRYDRATYTKVFTGGTFLCKGCHWLKSLPHRIDTWLQQQRGLLPAAAKPPHIIDCLGWTQAEVDALRDHDLRSHIQESAKLRQVEQAIQQGNATVAPAPMQRLAPQEIAA